MVSSWSGTSIAHVRAHSCVYASGTFSVPRVVGVADTGSTGEGGVEAAGETLAGQGAAAGCALLVALARIDASSSAPRMIHLAITNTSTQVRLRRTGQTVAFRGSLAGQTLDVAGSVVSASAGSGVEGVEHVASAVVGVGTFRGVGFAGHALIGGGAVAGLAGPGTGGELAQAKSRQEGIPSRTAQAIVIRRSIASHATRMAHCKVAHIPCC